MQSPLFVLAFLLFALSPQQPPAAPAQPPAAPAKPTQSTIPAEAAHMVNPVKPTPASQAQAKTIYGYDCAMCHGDNGNGKGSAAADMQLTMKNYTDPAALKDMTDGELFYVIKNGQGKMPGEDGRAKPNDMWNLVILLRSFSKQP